MRYVKVFCVLLVIAAVAAFVAQTLFSPRLPEASRVARLAVAKDASELVLVGATRGSRARVGFYTREEDGWHLVLETPAYIGRKGLGKTREGDGKTPVGCFRLTQAFGIAGDPGSRLPYTRVDETHYWVGDSRSEHYNRFVSTRDVTDFDRKESEHLIEYTKTFPISWTIHFLRVFLAFWARKLARAPSLVKH